MRIPLLASLASILAAASPAATVELRPLSGSATVAYVSPAASSGRDSDERYARTDAEFRASYYYGLGELASQEGHAEEAGILFGRAAEADPHSAVLLKAQGDAWEAAGKEALAVESFGKALALDPQDLELRQALARLHLRAGHKELAQSLFLKADGGDPDDAPSLGSLVGIDVSSDALPDAERRLRKLLSRSRPGEDLDEHELLALTLQRQERWKDAAGEYRGLLKADPSRSSAWARLAVCEDAQGDSAAALKALDDGLRALPDNTLLIDQEAKAYYRLERFADAEKAYDRLLSADDKDTQSLLYRGLARLKQKHYSQAQEDFDALGRLEKDSPSQLYGLGLSYLWQGKSGDAEKAFNKVIELNPQAVPAYTQLAFLYDKQGDTAKAVKLLERGHKAAPHSPELAMLLGAAYLDAKDYAAGEAVYKQALEEGEEKAVLRFQLAVLYDKWDKFPQAEEVLKGLVKDEPKNAQALNYLGYSWVERGGDLKEAEALIRRALAEDPKNAFYQDSLGWALFKEGKLGEAAEALQWASVQILKAADADDAESDQALVLDHLAEVRQAQGDAKAAQAAKADAQRLRDKAKARDAAPADPGKEPDL